MLQCGTWHPSGTHPCPSTHPIRHRCLTVLNEGSYTPPAVNGFSAASTSGKILARFAWAVVTVLLACGCGPQSHEVDRPAQDMESVLTEDEALRLDALGYLEFAPPPPDDASTGVVVHLPQLSSIDYVLLTYPVLARAELVDSNGDLVWDWKRDFGNWERAVLTANGDLLVVATEATGDNRKRHRVLLRLGFNGELLWKRQLPVHHHAVEISDGRIAVLTSRARRLSDPEGVRVVLDNGILLLSPDGEPQEEQSLTDMLTANPDLFTFRPVVDEDGKPARDFIHANFLHWMPGGKLAAESPLFDATNVMVTSRKQDTVAIVDWVRGRVLWAWGQGEIVGPHDACLLTNGNLLIFDNRSRSLESDQNEQWSRVIELDPLTRSIVWEYRGNPQESFCSHSRGTVQRLSGGTTLIGSSNQGRVFEVTSEGQVVWEYRTPHRNDKGEAAVLRAGHYEQAFIKDLLPR